METGSTSEIDLGFYSGRSRGQRIFIGLITSLLCGCLGSAPFRAAERLEVQFEDMSIPIPVNDLGDWVDGMSIPNSIRELSEWAVDGGPNSDLSSWLNLLDLESRAGLAKILKAPLIKNRSLAREILKSWVGRQLLDEVSDLVRLDDDKSGNQVFNTLERLLENHPQVTTMDLLLALPGESLHVDLDAFLQIANRWRTELKNQQQLVIDLGSLPFQSKTSSDDLQVLKNTQEPLSKFQTLSVDHRSDDLTLEVATS